MKCGLISSYYTITQFINYIERGFNDNYHKKTGGLQRDKSINSYEEEAKGKVSAESPDSYDLSLSMETKVFPRNSSAKDREQLMPSGGHSTLRASTIYQTGKQLTNGVC